jgi:hypothetical protein
MTDYPAEKTVKMFENVAKWDVRPIEITNSSQTIDLVSIPSEFAILGYKFASQGEARSSYPNWHLNVLKSELESSTKIRQNTIVLTNRNKEEVLTDDLLIDEKRYKVLESQFKHEFSNSVLDEEEVIFETFTLIANELSKLPFSKSVVEITTGATIKFSLALEVNKVLMVSKTFKRYQGEPSNSVVFSIFIDRKLIVSDVAEIKGLVRGLHQYLTY